MTSYQYHGIRFHFDLTELQISQSVAVLGVLIVICVRGIMRFYCTVELLNMTVTAAIKSMTNNQKRNTLKILSVPHNFIYPMLAVTTVLFAFHRLSPQLARVYLDDTAQILCIDVDPMIWWWHSFPEWVSLLHPTDMHRERT